VKHFDPPSRRVGKVDILERHITLQSRQGGWQRGTQESLHFAGFPEEFPNALRGSDGPLQLAV
jgi:hypothetical protein